MSTKERLIMFLKHIGIGQLKFEKNVNLSRGFVNKVGDSIRTENLNKISAIYPDLNTAWLLTGEGNMIIDAKTMDDVKGRLISFINELGMSISKFEKINHLSNGYISSVKSIGSDKLSAILESFPNLNAEWLLTGEGSMLKDNKTFDDVNNANGTNNWILGDACNDLKSLRKSLGLKQSELASKLGITQSYYSEIESGKKQISETINDAINAIYVKSLNTSNYQAKKIEIPQITNDPFDKLLKCLEELTKSTLISAEANLKQANANEEQATANRLHAEANNRYSKVIEKLALNSDNEFYEYKKEGTNG